MGLRKLFSRPAQRRALVGKEQEEQRKVVHKLENRKNTDRAKFKEALTSYKKDIRRLK
jgi:hypothetical protein